MMTTFDFATFEKAFGHVASAFRLKQRPAERTELVRTYFAVLERHPIDAVVAAGRRCTEKLRTFPKAADWLAELGPVGGVPACLSDSRYMSVEEADALEQAYALNFTDAPCACEACVAAGVADRPLRFVPSMVDALGFERAFNPRRNKVEVVGHWAHGAELAAWYAAKATFRARAGVAPRTLLRAVATILGEREPGEEG